MPNSTEKQRRELKSLDREIRKLSPIICIKSARRYLKYLILKRADLRRRCDRRKYRINERIDELLDQEGATFRTMFNVTPEEMRMLVERFEDDEVFSAGRWPVRYQMAVTVYKMAHGASDEEMARKFGVKIAPFVEIWTDRVFRAINRQVPEMIAWPSPTERTTLKRDIRQKHGIPDCVGFVDHTYFPIRPLDLAHPPPHRTVYDPRPPPQSIDVLGSIDDSMRFTYIASRSDFPIFARSLQYESTLERKPAKHYRSGEYLLAPESFVSTVRIITPFRNSEAGLDDGQIYFNGTVKTAITSIQRAFALVKARWRIVNTLSPVSSEAEEERALSIILAAFCLHNLTVASWEMFVSEETLGSEVLKAEKERVPEPEPEVDPAGYINGKLGIGRRERLVEKMVEMVEMERR